MPEISEQRFDVAVIGSGPGGQKAALEAAKAGCRVAIVERERVIGGACLHRGTIPSKTIRDAALRLSRAGEVGMEEPPPATGDREVAVLMARLERVVRAHVHSMQRQLERASVHQIHGRARFLSPREIAVHRLSGADLVLRAETIVIATGSRPRAPADLPIDHERVLDSDSILSLLYLPRSLVVLGGGVIASEYASIFAQLGVEVTMVDRSPRPLRFIDGEIIAGFLAQFQANGGRYLGGRQVADLAWDGFASVRLRLQDGEELAAEKVLVALGRIANVEDLGLDAAGLEVGGRGVIDVDEFCRTRVPHIYAVGDVIGPPALASSSMEQGRRAMRHALGLPAGHPPELSPMGIFTIPEIASVGLAEEQAREREGEVVVGHGWFEEVARGQIADTPNGMLKLVVRPGDRRLLGVHVLGEGATELIHLGQIALMAGWAVDELVENIFNFPTLAEAYRLAALDALEQLERPEAPASLRLASSR